MQIPPESPCICTSPTTYSLFPYNTHMWRRESSRYRDQTRGWTIRGSNPGRRRRVSLLQNVKTGFETHQFSYSMCTGVLSREYNGWGVTLNINLHLESRLRTSGAVLVLPLYAFMAWAGTTLRASFLVHGCQEYRLYRAEISRPVATIITDLDRTWKQAAA